MEFKMTFSMDKKTIECIDRLAGALAGIKNLALLEGTELVNAPEKPQESIQEPIPDSNPLAETSQETVTEPQNWEPQAEPAEPIPEPLPQPETATRVYTRDELSKASADFARLGADKREQLQKHVSEKYGVTGIMNIPEERYGEFAADLREMGANI